MKQSGGMSRVYKSMWEVTVWPVGSMRPPSMPLTPAELDELRELVKGIPASDDVTPVPV